MIKQGSNGDTRGLCTKLLSYLLSSFDDDLCNLDFTVSSERIFSEYWIGRYVEGSGRWLLWGV